MSWKPRVPGDQPTRLGLTTSKRIGNAVTRNRVRRLLRELFRHSPELFPNNADIVLIAKQGSARWNGYADAEQSIRRLQPKIRRALQAKP